MKIIGSSPIYPTEDQDKVLECLKNIFPDAHFEISTERVEFTCENLDHFFDLILDQKIRDTTAMVLERGLVDGETSFFLNKQASFMSKVNFTDGNSNLGDIEVRIIKGAPGLIEEIRPVFN